MSKRGTRLTIVQYAGDFREAAERLSGGGAETYRGQRYTVDYVEGLAKTLDSVTTITGYTEQAYDVMLPSGARAIGAGFTKEFDGARMAWLVEQTEPDLLILRSPIRPVLWWALRRRCRSLILLADSFDKGSLKGRLSQLVLSLFLKAPTFDWVANHGVRSAEQLVAAGVPAWKVVAWDYPAFDTPQDRPAKMLAGASPRILFVGLMMAEKGVDDLIRAAKLLREQGRPVHVDLVGKLDGGRLADLIAGHGMADCVTQIGPVKNAEVVPLMQRADVVIVPSRHEYPEGMPLTIYEALCSRTPLIVSDHPMFLGNVVHEESGLIFRAGDADDLAAKIAALCDDPTMYARISEGSLVAWNRLQIPLKWADLIDDWLENSPESRARLAAHALTHGSRARVGAGAGPAR